MTKSFIIETVVQSADDKQTGWAFRLYDTGWLYELRGKKIENSYEKGDLHAFTFLVKDAKEQVAIAKKLEQDDYANFVTYEAEREAEENGDKPEADDLEPAISEFDEIAKIMQEAPGFESGWGTILTNEDSMEIKTDQRRCSKRRNKGYAVDSDSRSDREGNNDEIERHRSKKLVKVA